MAKKPLTDEQLDALLAKGYISNDFYDSVKPEEDKDKALKAEASRAEQDMRLAENTMKKNAASDATDTGKTAVSSPFVAPPGQQVTAPVVNRPYVPPPGTKTLPPVTIVGNPPPPAPPAKEQKGLLNQAWDWVTGANDPMYNETGGQLKGANPAGEAVAKQVEQNVKKKEEEASAVAKPGELASDQPTAKPMGLPGGGAPVAPPKPQFSPEMAALIKQLEDSYGGQKVGLGEIRDVASKMGTRQSEIERNTIADLDVRAKAEAERSKAEHDYMFNEIAQLKAKNAELANSKINPYGRMDTGQKVLAGIGLLFGAGGTRKGGQNPALESINKAIDRDIDAQKAEIAYGFKSLENQSGLLAQYMKVTDSRVVAEHAAKMDMLQRAKLQLDNVATDMKGPTAQANYDIASAALDEKLAEQKIQLQRALEASAKGGAGGAAVLKSANENNRYIAEALEKAGIPSVENAIAQAQDAVKTGESMGILSRGAIDAANKSNPLLGAVATAGYGAVNPQALQTEQALQNLASEYLLMKTGKAATDSERQSAAQTLFGDRSPEAIARGMDMVKQQVRARKNNILSGSTEEGRLESARRKGQEERISPTTKPGEPGAAK